MFFQFESDFVDNLRCIPMQVRLKLDTCGIKLKLAEWNCFTQAERAVLVELPCENPDQVSKYQSYLRELILQHTGKPATDLAIAPQPAWLNMQEIPPDVQTKATSVGVNLTLEQWVNLTPLQRFALIKLSRSSHENANFLPALQEFNLC